MIRLSHVSLLEPCSSFLKGALASAWQAELLGDESSPYELVSIEDDVDRWLLRRFRQLRIGSSAFPAAQGQVKAMALLALGA